MKVKITSSANNEKRIKAPVLRDCKLIYVLLMDDKGATQWHDKFRL